MVRLFCVTSGHYGSICYRHVANSARELVRDYELPEDEVREQNLNRFMAHIGEYQEDDGCAMQLTDIMRRNPIPLDSGASDHRDVRSIRQYFRIPMRSLIALTFLY